LVAARNETRGTVLADDVEVGAGFMAKLFGLMGRRSLPAGHGLWLPGDNGIHMFFMRFPIDAIFVGREAADGSRPVVAARAGLRPWTGIVPLIRGADGVVELPVGTVVRTGTERGDSIRIA